MKPVGLEVKRPKLIYPTYPTTQQVCCKKKNPAGAASGQLDLFEIKCICHILNMFCIKSVKPKKQPNNEEYQLAEVISPCKQIVM